MHTVLARSLRFWLPIAVAVTALSGLVFVEVQQVLRQSADDPQTQMAEDAAASLGEGSAPSDVLASPSVDVAASLAPFLIVYDRQGVVVSSSVTLDGRTPSLPAGVLASARLEHEDHVTWQPQAGVRIAAVVVPYRGGAVLAGRSLREVEKREAAALGIAAIAWLFALIVTAVAVVGVVAAAERSGGGRPRSDGRMLQGM